MLRQVALASAMIILTAGIQMLFTVVGVRTLRRHVIGPNVCEATTV